MISIAELLRPEGIRLELREKKKKRVISELAGLLQAMGFEDTDFIAKRVLLREKSASTGIGHGVAVPHALDEHIEKTVMVFGRSSSGVPFEAADGRPVHLFFLLVGPSSSPADHLKLLSKLSRMVTDKEFRGALLEAKDPEEVIELFQKEEEA